MHFHYFTIIRGLIIFQLINKILAQSAPASPCPQIFQYRFDGTQWFGLLSVPNPKIEQPLHLSITLSLKGKPATNYLGEIELLTRGEYTFGAPIFYKVKFPLSNFIPKLMQITTNNQLICLGPPDHSMFVTQIDLKHTRKVTFMPDTPTVPMQQAPSSPSLLLSQATDTLKRRLSNNICGATDKRIPFEVLRKLRETTGTSIPFENPTVNIADSLLLAKLWRQQGDADELSTGSKIVSENETSIAEDNMYDDISLPPLVTSDLYADALLDNDSSMANEDLPTLPTRGFWPWLAAIYVNNLTSLTYRCGGTLISKRVVITAAHCLHLFKQRYTANDILVFLGRHNLRNWNEENSLAAPVDDIFIHPDYNHHLNSYDADIAVLILKNKVGFNTFIRPACMWSGSTEQKYIEGELGFVVGWGFGNINSTRHTSSSSSLPIIHTTSITSKHDCFRANSKYYNISSNRTFCAGSMNFQQPAGPCSGDSGSGLLIFKSNRWTLRGIVAGSLPLNSTVNLSRATPGCSINQYVIYTDVAKFIDWIYAFLI